ncbi:hypothetical protein VNO78_12377 [Psophocarpus tetragonolobus]|uniref:Uncharacterized protein n=1 Tax=Psophocarpus tetragonolobus TaxID=3891 RepID=A0AAN9XPH4_PSOTE
MVKQVVRIGVWTKLSHFMEYSKLVQKSLNERSIVAITLKIKMVVMADRVCRYNASMTQFGLAAVHRTRLSRLTRPNDTADRSHVSSSTATATVKPLSSVSGEEDTCSTFV